jgi:carbamoyltransferase
MQVQHREVEHNAECQNTTRHDAAVAVAVNGRIYAIAAERVDRIKHSCDAATALAYMRSRFPRTAFSELDCTYTPYREPHHHLAHAASAYYTSPFSRALILVVDGMGPYAAGTNISTSFWLGSGDEIANLRLIREPGICYRSVGHYFAAANYYLGFPFHDVSFTMSLASYGDAARYRDAVASLIWPTSDGLFETDRDFIRFATHMRFGSEFNWKQEARWLDAQRARYEAMFGPMRHPDGDFLERHRDFAAAIQERLEVVLRALVGGLRSLGGVALNCVANQRVLAGAGFENVHIQPAASDDGIALGRLLHHVAGARDVERRETSPTTFLGPPYSRRDLETAIDAARPAITARRLVKRQMLEEVAGRLAAGDVIGWVQGRSEFGPRALGHRSLLADARNPKVGEEISRKFKKREWFRPFAPSVLESRLVDYFDIHPSMRLPMRFMLAAVAARPQGTHTFPGAIHVDGTARVQAVPEDGAIFSLLLSEFERQTGVPGLLNTSLNPPGAPIVETPADAIAILLSTRLDALALGPWLIERRGS